MKDGQQITETFFVYKLSSTRLKIRYINEMFVDQRNQSDFASAASVTPKQTV